MMRKLTLLVCLLILGPVGISFGQNFDSMYGSGIHKFFSGCNAEAIQLFDAAIAANPNDPRPYYFRGLAKMNFGDQYAAQADFQAGAQMEAMGNRPSSMVSRSLERIQGNNRLCIEQARQNALNPSLQTARNRYYASPKNVVYGQPLTYPAVPANALAPSASPSQTIVTKPMMPSEVSSLSAQVVTESTEITAPANLSQTMNSTTTSLPATPETSNVVPPADATSAVKSGLGTPMTADGLTTNPRTQNPTSKSSDAGEPLQAAGLESTQADSPDGTEPAAEATAPASNPTPAIDEPIEFPSEPIDESPFGDAQPEGSEDSLADETPVEDIPMEDESAVPPDSNDELPADEESDVLDNPFGG